MTEILFVCTGNTCRSPMAEYLLRDLAEKADKLNIVARSAGLFARDGDSASVNARYALEMRGIDLLLHRSRLIALPMLKQADLILGMTWEHKRVLAENFSLYQGKVYTLGEFIGEPELEIADPFGQSARIYQQTAGQLNAVLIKLLSVLERMRMD